MTDVRDTLEDDVIPGGGEDALEVNDDDLDANAADDEAAAADSAAAEDSDESMFESGSTESSEEGSDKDEKTPPVDDPNEALLQAMNHKEEGNNHFKSGDLISAARSYRHGTTLLKNLNQGNTGDEQVKQLIISLQTNLSMVCFKQNKHKMSRDIASKALEVEKCNVKALYRRAVASRAMGDVDAARADLKEALKLDPVNTAVKKELLAIKKSLEDLKQKEKARLQKAFSKSGSLLYSDKEAEEKRKLEEKKEQERQEAEALKKRKQEWEDECVRRMSSEPPEEAISYDDWDKARKKEEEDEEKARKKAKKEEEDRKREEKRKAREAQKASSKSNDNDSSDDELTEKEMAMLRGYKKTSDGRTTSYFNREQTEQEKELIGCIKPKRLEEVSSTPSPTAASQTPLNNSSVGSVWNAAGTTWEEKDTTEWCRACLTECLKEATAVVTASKAEQSLTYMAVVKEITSLTGDASVALAGGKKRYIYDFHTSIKYDILDDGDDKIASGTLHLPDINSATTAEEELEVDISGWKKAPSGEGVNLEDAVACQNLLVQDVRKSVLRFVEKFNANF
jgi:tetratricopeptide (TPR) repeat protein